ncbi:MAG: hypothetical protein AB1724_05255 [Thermodesulfobacteriota bacterium]
MYKILTNRIKFDFEIGYFIKSPCRDCDRRKEFPRCFEECLTLDKVRTVLAESLSCYNPRSSV